MKLIQKTTLILNDISILNVGIFSNRIEQSLQYIKVIPETELSIRILVLVQLYINIWLHLVVIVKLQL